MNEDIIQQLKQLSTTGHVKNAWFGKILLMEDNDRLEDIRSTLNLIQALQSVKTYKEYLDCVDKHQDIVNKYESKLTSFRFDGVSYFLAKPNFTFRIKNPSKELIVMLERLFIYLLDFKPNFYYTLVSRLLGRIWRKK